MSTVCKIAAVVQAPLTLREGGGEETANLCRQVDNNVALLLIYVGMWTTM
jgi:hypothetical protein